MEYIKKESIVQRYNSIEELPQADQQLLTDAKAAVKGAYAPYSKFNVGCALRLTNGIVVKGNNQENIAYPSGLCAERVAIFYAGATYPDIPVESMAITVKANGYVVNEPIMSCGACLQSMSEYELKYHKPMRIILQGETGDIYVAEGLRNFMPFMFWVDELRK
jgi:cytidine deaminase